MDARQASAEGGSLGNHVKSDESLPDNLQDALVDIFRPILHDLEVVVEETRNSQQDVKRQIDLLSEELYQISSICEVSPTLEMYAKKMATIKRRVTVMYNILQNVQERLKKLEHIANANKVAVPLLPPTTSPTVTQVTGNSPTPPSV